MNPHACLMRILISTLLILSTTAPAQDRDRDGLSDFQERHKYKTDPSKADSDGDGIPDGDWLERREFNYVIRSVVQVMKPVTIEFLNDDYQDARILDETEDHIELEVIHYPFNSVASTIVANSKWRKDASRMKEWLKPGPTSDWTPSMRRKLVAALKKDGIDVKRLDDKTLVEKASAWLVNHAQHHDGFTSFITAFDAKGKPYVPDDLKASAERGIAEKGLTLEQQWKREVSAKGMFEAGARGSCTSSAIYMSGCLRALGIPTRTVLCIPLVDASDPTEVRMVKQRLEHNGIRRLVKDAVDGGENSWTSHTFNEVFVGGRWRRLNYSRLGQNIIDSGGSLGIMTHVATFFDWADAKMPETVGRRQKSNAKTDVFGGRNPYSTVSLRDQFGVHCRVENPPADQEQLAINRLVWSDSKELPEGIFDFMQKEDRFGLVAHLNDVGDTDDLRSFLAKADLRLYLHADGHPRLSVGLHANCWWADNGRGWIYVPFGPADRRDHMRNVLYRPEARNGNQGFALTLEDDLRVSTR